MNNNTKKNLKNQGVAKAVSIKHKNGTLRLMRDLKDWIKSKDEFPCINAVPLDENIFEWHCNICPDSGDFKNVTFHLIMYFDEEYPVLPPKVKLCTSIPHPNVFDEWICLDMIKRDGDNGYKNDKKYQGWTPAYSVTSILMQLQSFLFSQSSVEQMNHGGINVDRSFDPVNFQWTYMPKIKKFVCDKCKHCYTKPFPVTLSISKQLGLIEKQKITKEKCGVKVESKDIENNNKDNRKQKKKNFCLWDGLYHDVEMLIFGFFKLNDLIKLKRVAKRFKYLVNNSKIIQKDSIKCWFHRALTIPTATTTDNTKENVKILCLGVGVNPIYFDTTTTLDGQIFGSPYLSEKIGHLKMIKSIDTTFDLLSSDAFVKFGIRNTVFNDCKFTHFIPLYINEKHGKKAMNKMDKFVLKLWNKNSKHFKCHPWLKLYTIANMMKSLIVSVMQDCDNKKGVISLHYSTNVLETFFRLHHTLIGIYFTYKKELRQLLQHQIGTFFSKDKKSGGYRKRDKKRFPDFGIFLSYLTLWEKKKINSKKCTWSDIAYELLDEIFTRQSKWVLNAHHGLIDPKYCSLEERTLFRWKTNGVSNRLFMFNSFFFRHCCKLGCIGINVSLKEQFDEYNSNFGFPKDDNLAFKFQKFVKNIHGNISNFEAFFDIIGVKYPGNKKLGLWFIECMNESEYRGYHKRHLYVSKYGLNNPNARKIHESKRNNWIKQQQREREQLKKEKQEERLQQQRLEQRRLKQVEESKIHQTRGKRRSKNSLPVQGTFSFSKVTRGRVVEDNVFAGNIRRGSCDYVRVYLRLTQSEDDVGSLDEMIIDAHNRVPRLNAAGTDLDESGTQLFGKLFDTFANNKDGTMSRNDLKNYIIYYEVGNKNVSVNDKVNQIFDKFSNDKKKEKLTKKECFRFWTCRESTYEQVQQVAHYPDRFHDGVTIPIKKVNNNNNNNDNNGSSNSLQTMYYSDFCTSRIFWQIDGMSNVTMRVRGKYIDGKPFEFVQLSKQEEYRYQCGYLAPLSLYTVSVGGLQQPNLTITTPVPPTQPTAHERQQQQPQRQRQRSHETQRGKQSLQSSKKLIILGNKKETTRKINKLEKEMKDWLKTERNRIEKKLSNGNVSPYASGKRREIKSQIHNDKVVDSKCPSIKFCISTIKNGVVSHNVNEISLDCEIVRVSVILTSQVSYELGVNQIYFDGESDEKSKKKSLGKCYNWTKNNTKNNNRGDMVRCQSVVVHGPIYGKHCGSNVVYYSDFSLEILFNRFGKGLKNGIMPRARGYTIDANEYELYFCGGYDYLICGKFHTSQGNNDKQMKHQVVRSVPALAPPQRPSRPFQPPQTGQMSNIKNPTLEKEKQQEHDPKQLEQGQEMSKHVKYEENTESCLHHSEQHKRPLAPHSRMSQLYVSQHVQMGNYWNQAQFVPVCNSNGQHNFVNNQGNGVIVGYLVPIAMAMAPMQQVGNIQYTEQRAPMPRPIPHGVHNGAIPRRPPMKNMFSNNSNNSNNNNNNNNNCKK